MKKPQKKMLVYFPENTKEELEKMADELGLSQSQLIVMATTSMLANYRMRGSLIFADLLNPEHKQYPVQEEKLLVGEDDQKGRG